MSLCINPECSHPYNLDTVGFCQSCGTSLLFADCYRVFRELGQGGFGRTYEVTDGSGRKVLKILTAGDPKAVSLFQQEAHLLQSLDRPGIPKGDGYFTFPLRNSGRSLHGLVMEYVEGEDLSQWLHSRGDRPLDEPSAIAWLRELVTILHYVHQENFFHRDIKPSNIILKPDGHLTLIDFGSAREVSATYLQKVGQGKPVTGIVSAGYTAPEQAMGRARPQSDFFALGRTFVFLLTAKAPTDFQEDPRSGRLLWRDGAPGVSSEFANLLDELMALLPGDRPQTTVELLKRLDTLLPSTTASGSTASPSATAATLAVNRQAYNPPTTTTQIPGSRGRSWILAGMLALLGFIGVQVVSQQRQGGEFSSGESTRSPEPTTEVPSASPSAPSSPDPTATPTATATPTPTPTPTATPTPTPTPTPMPTPTTSPTTFTLQRAIAAHPKPVYAVAVASDRGIVATSSAENEIELWNIDTGEEIRRLARHGGPVWSLSVSPDGQTLASGSADNQILLWNLSNGRVKQNLYGHRDQVRTVAFDPRGRWLASGAGGVYESDRSIRIWDLDTGETRYTLTGHTDRVLAIAWSPDGQTLASGSADQTIKLWDVASQNLIQELPGNTPYVESLAFTPDGRTLVSSNSNEIKLWDVATGSLTRRIDGHQREVSAIAITPDGRYLASGSGDTTVKLWNLNTGELVETLPDATDGIRSLTFSADGRTAIAGDDGGRLYIWQTPSP
jgi:WD40 repeat protein